MTRQTRLLAFGASASAFALAVHLGAGALAERSVDAALARAGGHVGHRAVSLDWMSGRVTISGVTVHGDDGSTLSIGRVTLPTPYALVSPALAAGDVTVESVTLAGGALAVNIPKIELKSTDASKETILGLFDKAATTPLSGRLAAISAASVNIPEVAIASENKDTKTAAVYKDVRFDDVRNGVIKAITVSGGTVDSTGPDGTSAKGTYGAVTMADVDMALMAKVYGEVAGPGDTEMKTLYSSFTLDGMAMDAVGKNKDGAKITIGKMAGKDIKARPTATPLLGWAQAMSGRKPEEMNPEEKAKFFNGIADILESFSIGSMEMNSMEVVPAGMPGKGKLARIAFQGAAVGKPNEIRIEGFDVTAPEGYGRIGLISHSGWSYKPTIAALREAFGKPDSDPASVDPRAFIPEIGTLTLRDLEMDVPDAKARQDNPKAPNIRLGLKGFELQASDPIQGVPTGLRISSDHLTMGLPAGSKEPGLKDLLAMGYKDLDGSSSLDLRWTEATTDLRLAQAASVVNMGSFSLKGSFGNIPKDVFTGDPATAQISLLGATVKDAALTVENKGLFEKALEYQAKQMKKSPDQLRKELAAGAQVGIPAILGNSPAAKQIAGAVAKFVAKPNRLVITAQAKDPAGLGLADIGAAGGDPRALLDSLNVTATAE